MVLVLVLAPSLGGAEVAVGAVLALGRGDSVPEGGRALLLLLALLTRLRGLLLRAALDVAAHVLRHLTRQVHKVSTLGDKILK